MIVRKPYAFLIKNFKKIHILLLILSLFVAYKLFDVNHYVNEFIRLGTYDFFGDPITKHITIPLRLCIGLLVIGSASLLFLLLYKKKPWKVYLIPIIEYFSLLLVLAMIRNFFRGYSSSIDAADLRLSRDLLLIFLIVQVPAIGIYIMRVFGLDIKKFQFNSDQEFLELSEEDREEIEIELNVDKYSFIRFFKRLWRNLGYIYKEHQGLCLGILTILGVISIVNGAYFIFVTNRSYSEGEFYKVNGYTFQVKNVYFTDKDNHGDVISKKSNFVIVDLQIENRGAARTIYLENFHLKNGTSDVTTTRKTYAKEFQDLGVPYESKKKIKKGEILNCIIIFKVDKALKKNKFVLYYQEGNNLRKIKLNVKDVSKIDETISLKMGDSVELGMNHQTDTIIFETSIFHTNIDYTVRKCAFNDCLFETKSYNAPDGSRILEIIFSSEDYEAKNMIDFLNNYGKLNYRDSKDEDWVLEIENPISERYYGKSIFLKVPAEVEEAKSITLDLVVRSKHYIIELL